VGVLSSHECWQAAALPLPTRLRRALREMIRSVERGLGGAKRSLRSTDSQSLIAISECFRAESNAPSQLLP
jgi:hypothetical protein